jgi:hypothetical protein
VRLCLSASLIADPGDLGLTGNCTSGDLVFRDNNLGVLLVAKASLIDAINSACCRRHQHPRLAFIVTDVVGYRCFTDKSGFYPDQFGDVKSAAGRSDSLL